MSLRRTTISASAWRRSANLTRRLRSFTARSTSSGTFPKRRTICSEPSKCSAATLDHRGRELCEGRAVSVSGIPARRDLFGLGPELDGALSGDVPHAEARVVPATKPERFSRYRHTDVDADHPRARAGRDL